MVGFLGRKRVFIKNYQFSREEGEFFLKIVYRPEDEKVFTKKTYTTGKKRGGMAFGASFLRE